MRFLTELRCENLRPELFRLMEHLEATNLLAPPLPLKVILQMSLKQGSQDGERLNPSANRTHWRAAARAAFSRDDARTGGWPQNIPPILLALFGETPRNSTAVP